MQHVSIALLQDDLTQAGLLLARFGRFAPRRDADGNERLPDLPGEDYRAAFFSARGYLQKITDFLGLHPKPDRDIPDRAPALETLRELEQRLRDTWQHCSACAESSRHYADELRELHHLRDLLASYRHLDLDLGMLRRRLRFLHLQTGTIPQENRNRLRQAIAMIGYSHTEVSRREGKLHVIIAGLEERADKLQTVLKAADFHPLELPEAFADHPDKVARQLTAREQKVLQEQRHLQKDIERRAREEAGQLNQATAILMAASGFAQFGSALQGRGGLARIEGWTPADRIGELKSVLEQGLSGPVVTEHRPPTKEESRQVPSAIEHPSWLQPFARLVKNFGTPRYTEIDPTWFFALSFLAMFGMMFGDVGHGALIFLAPLMLRRQLAPFAPILMGAGISSMIFGLLYGSVFGYEHLISALWIPPLSNPVLMLQVAFFWGVGFITLASLLTIRNNLADGRYGPALLDSQGLAGLTLYLGLLAAGAFWLQQGRIPRGVTVVPAVSLALVLMYKWHSHRAPLGERLLVVLIEGFETFMNYISNTLSFLRVAAFGLNHVALAIAVFTLANMMDSTGHWITVVLGNLFILLLEGAIVVIQVLRLEYYEGFSRFFRGDGHAFRPMRLSADTLYE
jgi:V/A-type H+-transporting ATPase subunit I